ncbi:NUDIX hydrolase [Riemerella columbipharyngis]|uniref:NUDIX domain-containing protein n=1 Tax=Riemerella columbipharyngis TaxID=1071918 RepID=A0A1G6ZI62_9FLAO|nr:NUDIX domain-containing protein [Riemerella columbipharyngis]SDE02220.1 NUDIX domain-containing protein [Riemerella columbipharyngis]
MYKVFINDKKICLSKKPQNLQRDIPYTGAASLEKAIEYIERVSISEVGVYGENLDLIWENFQAMFKIIEAAGGVVLNSKKEILFIHRLGRWDLPKGKLEKGETPKKGAKREVEEETGVNGLKISELVETTYHIYINKKDKKILKKTYWYLMNTEFSDKLIPQAEEGITDVAWKSFSEVQYHIFPKTFQNIQIVLNTFFKMFR